MPLKTIRYCVAVSCLLTLTGCSKPAAPVRNWTPTALGEISADRCIFYTEAEDFKEKAGGERDYKTGASKGVCLGMRWGDRPTDFASYAFNLEKNSPATTMVLRVAFEGARAQTYNVLIDGQIARNATVMPTGGYGYDASQWACFSLPLGRIDKGPHTLTIKSLRPGQVINMDCLALGRQK